MDHDKQDADHALILDKIAELNAKIEDHVNQMHATLVPRDEIIRRDEAVRDELRTHLDETGKNSTEVSRQLNEIADIVLGQPHVNFDGEVVRTGGMQKMVKDYSNGGFKVHFPVWFKAAFGSVVVAVGTIIAALITAL